MNEAIEKVLLSKEITPTPMRILVLEYLQKQLSAVSLQQLENVFQYSDRVTIYRTLKTFEEKGLVHGIQDGTESRKYALCAETCKAGDHYDLHLHFYCYNCKQTYCLPKLEVTGIKPPENFQLKELSLLAKGICENCARQQCN